MWCLQVLRLSVGRCPKPIIHFHGISMSVFCRTERGQVAAYAAQSELPHKLRAMLKVIDGQTSVEIYEQKLSAFGDVRGILKALETAGLITPVIETAPLASAQPSGQPDPYQVVAVTVNDEWAETCDGYAQTVQQPTPARRRAEPETIALPRSTDLRRKLQSETALDTAKRLMAQFSLSHLPAQAADISEQLHQINDLEMLAVMLGGYEGMVSHLGQAATEHLVDIKRIVYRNL
jgi:hypothetical protein